MNDAGKYTSKLSGARVLIIAGSSGIGYCVAKALLESGAAFIIASSQESRVRSSIETLIKSYPSAKDRVSGIHVTCLPAQWKQTPKLYWKTGTVDHMIYTAGDKLAALPIQEVTLKSIQKAVMVRFFAPLLMAKFTPRYFSGGPASSLTLTTGSVLEKPIPGWPVIASYAVGHHGMVRNLALDLAPVCDNLVSPGVVETSLWDGTFLKEDLQTINKTRAKSKPQVN